MTTQQNGGYPVSGVIVVTIDTNDEDLAQQAAENVKTGSDFQSNGYLVNSYPVQVPQGDSAYITAIAVQCEASTEQFLEEMQDRVEEKIRGVSGVGVMHALRYVVREPVPQAEDKYIRGYFHISGSSNYNEDAQRIMDDHHIYRDAASGANIGVICRVDVLTDSGNVQRIVATYVAYISDAIPAMEAGIRAAVGPIPTITRFTVQQYEDYHGDPDLPQRHIGIEEMHAPHHSHGNSYG